MLRDPKEDNYLALCLSILWYRELTPEEAFRIIEGKSNMKPECHQVTQDMITVLTRIISSKNFRSWDKLERSFKLNRYTIFKLVGRYRVEQLCRTIEQIRIKKGGI